MEITPAAQQEDCHSGPQWDWNFWEAPQDPDRPLLPYLPGFSIQIFRHVGELEDAALEQRPRRPGNNLRSVTHSEVVVDNLTAEEIQGPSLQAETAQLVITSTIAIGSARGAQIIACTVTPQDGSPFEAVAKIYDPLYYSFEYERAHCPLDPVNEADHEFLVESFHYEKLQEAGQTGSFAAEYYGSWWFTLPIVVKSKPIARPVRLILMERLNGTTIQGHRVQNSYKRTSGLDAFHFPEPYRLEVLARAMDGYVRQLAAGIGSVYFAGCNIMLVPDENITTQSETMCGLVLPRIVFVDYNSPGSGPQSSDGLDSRPINPALKFWGDYLRSDIAGWVPNTWIDPKVQEDWLLQRFCGHGLRELYRPIPEWMDSLVRQRDSGSQKDSSGHASVTEAVSPRGGEVDSKTGPSRSDGSDDKIGAGFWNFSLR